MSVELVLSRGWEAGSRGGSLSLRGAEEEDEDAACRGGCVEGHVVVSPLPSL